MVSFDTTSEKSNIAIVDFIESFLRQNDVMPIRILNDEKTKASLFYTIGQTDNNGTLFSAHTDTVPANKSEWSSDPYKLTLKDNRYYGRGTTDMKGFISIVLALTPWFQEQKLVNPIHVALSYDEEVGCLGVGPLIDEIRYKIKPPNLVIVGEPTELKIIDRHKSCHTFETEFFGKKSHSANPAWGCNSIYYATEFITKLRDLEEKLKIEYNDHNFDPPYTTISVGQIGGGVAHNVVPDYTKVTWNIRCLPNIDYNDILKDLFINQLPLIEKKMKKNHERSYILNSNLSNIYPLRPSKILNTTNLIKENISPSQKGVSYGTDAGFFSNIGWPTIVCGPGNISQAHKADEFIEIEDIRNGILFFMDLIRGTSD